MPSRNIIKSYIAGGIYHAYSRGVEKRKIFLDEQDYQVFLKYIREALSPRLQGLTLQRLQRMPKNFHDEIGLYAFCLMPNHFHFLLQQFSERIIEEFMQSLLTRYSMYFNKKYHRVGSLFQSTYKAALVNEEPYLLHTSRYIHRNILEVESTMQTSHTSYLYYLKAESTDWLDVDFVLSFFSKTSLFIPQTISTYQKFVEEYRSNSGEFLGSASLEDEDL